MKAWPEEKSSGHIFALFRKNNLERLKFIKVFAILQVANEGIYGILIWCHLDEKGTFL